LDTIGHSGQMVASQLSHFQTLSIPDRTSAQPCCADSQSPFDLPGPVFSPIKIPMANFEEISFSDFVTNAVKDVFSTMLSMKVEEIPQNSNVDFNGERIVGSVGFAGKIMGVVYIHVSAEFARIMTATLLGMKIEEVTDEVNINDVIGEMSNMVGGNVKSHLCDAGFACALSIPSITRGIKFQIQCMDGAREERFSFKYQQHLIFVELKVKPGE
jgi:chemotaxis protein CheX